MVKANITGTNGWDKKSEGVPAPYLDLAGNGKLYEATGPNEKGFFVVYTGSAKKQLVHQEDIRLMERFGKIISWDEWKKRRGNEPWYASHIGEEFRIVEKNYPGLICFDNTGYAVLEDVEITARELVEQPAEV